MAEKKATGNAKKAKAKSKAKPKAKKAAAKPAASKAKAAKPKAKKAAAKKPAKKSAPKKASPRAGAGASGLDKSVAQFRESLEESVHISRDRIEAALDDAVKRGRMTRGDAEKLVSDIVKRGRKQTDNLLAELERLVKQARKEVGGRTGPRAIDHLLSRGVEVLAPATAWPPERRELPCDGRALRLSDHAPIEAKFGVSEPPALGN